MFMHVLSFVINQGDMWIAAATVRPTNRALFAAGARLIHLVATPLVLVSLAVLPSISEFHSQGRRTDLMRMLRAWRLWRECRLFAALFC